MVAKHVGPPGIVLYTWGLFIAAWLIHIALREFYQPGHPTRVAATVVVIAAGIVAVFGQIRMFRALDEFQQRVQLSALAFAFTASLVAVLGIGFLRAEGFFPGADPRDLAGLMMVLYAAGLALAWRRYQ